jgi:hypothetical protein
VLVIDWIALCAHDASGVSSKAVVRAARPVRQRKVMMDVS